MIRTPNRRAPRPKLSVSLPTAVFLLASFITGLGVGGVPAASASSPPATTVAFDSIPSTLPGNVPSVGFEATSTSEFGDYAKFANNPPDTHLNSVDVVMSSWGCESGHWYSGDCLTTPGATFSHPITLTIYNNDGGNLGSVVATLPQTFDIPFRPSADNDNCTGGRWFDGSTCYNGFATTITFDFSSQNVVLPPSVIYGISYNTTHYGASPIGEDASCYTSSGGCGYDSLNVGAGSTAPTVGTDDDPNGVFLNSSSGDSYCDHGSGGTNTFRLDSPCWTGNNPNVRFIVEAPHDPTNLDQLKPNGDSIASGGNTDGQDGNDRRAVQLQADVSDPDSSSSVKLEVEVKCVDCPNDQPIDITKQSASSAPGTGGTLSVTIDHSDGLEAGHDYVWRARSVDEANSKSNWVNFGNFDSSPAFDFRVPQADLSVVKTQSAAAADTCPNPTQSYLCVLAGSDLTYTLSVTNAGPDDASNVTVTDTLPMRTTYVSATGTGWSCGHLALVVTCTRPSLTSSTAPDISVVATAKPSLRHGPLTIQNKANVTSDVFDPDESSGGNDVSLNTEVHTVAEPPTKYDVQPGDTDAVASWSAPVANGGAPDGGEPIDFYRIVVANVGTSAGTGTGAFKVYDPASPGPAGTFVWTPCTGRLGGTFCFRVTGLTDDQTLPPTGPNVVYQFTIQAHNAVGPSDIGGPTTATATPSTNNKAVIVPPTTSSSFGTCTTATKANPICVQYQVPSGGGGVFSVQDTIKGYSTFDFSSFCGGPCTAGKGLGSFEGHPPAGYNDKTHPLIIIVTWDQTAWDNTAPQNEVWYQADSLHGGVPFVLAKCTNPNVDTAFPDPCLKKTNILGRKSAGCGTNAACFGDLQAQILLTSKADGGFSRH